MTQKVRVRFAPSPTGNLHVGGVRTALFNYLFAKQQGGQFILRLEDTDRERFLAEGVEQIVASLDWLGLKPDEGFWISQGQHQGVEYVQSQRHERGDYQKWADHLLHEGLAYYSVISTQRYQELKQSSDGPFVYKKAMETGEKAAGQAYPIRLDTAAVKAKLGPQIKWHDQVRGDFETAFDLIEDFILTKSDSYPTYNFANVIDDHMMTISHVIRGDEFISSTAKHALLYDLLGWQRPVFVHLPVINGTDGKKLSKRTGDTDTLEYRRAGYLPEALINFLALLGWNPGAGETQEIYSCDELIKRFSLERVQKSPAVFDPERLDWMNGQYIRNLDPEKLLDLLIEFYGDSKLSQHLQQNRTYSLAAVELIQDRIKRLGEGEELLSFFFLDPDPTTLKFPGDRELTKHYLSASLDQLLANAEAFNDATDLERLMRETIVAASGAPKPGPLFMAIRLALTGQTATPGLFETMVALGSERVLRRLEAARNALN